MTDTGEKLRALVLAALMVFSVFGGVSAIGGTAVANAPDNGSYAADSAPADQTVDTNTTQASRVIVTDLSFTTNGNVSNVSVNPAGGSNADGVGSGDISAIEIVAGLDDGTEVVKRANSVNSLPTDLNFSDTAAASGDSVQNMTVIVRVSNSASDGDDFDNAINITAPNGTSFDGTSPYDTQGVQTVTTNTGFISGTVTDGGTGASIVGAEVDVYQDLNQNNQIDSGDLLVKTVQSNPNGIYTVELSPENVSDGDDGYLLEVNRTGFQTFSSDRLSVFAGDTTTQNIVLKPRGTPRTLNVIYAQPQSQQALADGQDAITYYVQVRGRLGSQTNVPLNGTDVNAVDDGTNVNFDPSEGNPTALNTTQGGVTLPNGTTVNGVTSFTVSSDEAQTATLNFTVASNASINDQALATFGAVGGQGTIIGQLFDEESTNGLGPDAPVYAVQTDRFVQDTEAWEFDLTGASNDTQFVRVVDTNGTDDPSDDEIVPITDYRLKLADEDGNTNTGDSPADPDEYFDSDQDDTEEDGGDPEDEAAVGKLIALNTTDTEQGSGFFVQGVDDDEAVVWITPLEPGNYTVEVSDTAPNNSRVDQSIGDGDNPQESFTNLGYAGGNFIVTTEKYTLREAQNRSNATTGPRLVDRTNSDGDYLLSKLFTNGQEGVYYVVAGTDTGYTISFADVFVQEDGHEYEFSDDDVLSVRPIPVDPEVNITNIALLPGAGAAPSDPADPTAYDQYAYNNRTDAFSQTVPRDGSSIDVVLLETTAERTGESINETVTVSVPDRNEGAAADEDFNGSWIAVAGGQTVSEDPANDTITVATGQDGQAILWLQTDESTQDLDGVFDPAAADGLTCPVEVFSGITAVSTTDAGATDASCKAFTGITEFGSLSGIVTDGAQPSGPIPDADVWVQAFELTQNDVQVEITRINDTYANVSVYDDSGVTNRSDLTETGPLQASAEVAFDDLRDYRFEDFNQSVRQQYGLIPPTAAGGDSFTLYTQSAATEPQLGEYTLPRVPTKASNNLYSVRGETPVERFVGQGDGFTRTGVTDDVNIVIPAATGTNFQVSNLSAPATATQGDTINVTADVTNFGSVGATADVEFRLGGQTVATQTTEALSAGETISVTFEIDTSGVAPGTYTHGVFTVDSNETAEITIESGSGPEIVPGSPAQDPDGDGVFEDVNGDGDVTAGDATVLFNAVFDGRIASDDLEFDINGDGSVTAGDATVLFNEVFGA